MDKARFMEAVAAKVGKRAPVMKRKPGMSVVIAVGAPKPGPMMGKDEGEEMDSEKMSKADRIAALQEKIAYLKSQLALLEDEEEMPEDEDTMDEDESESEDEDEE